MTNHDRLGQWQNYDRRAGVVDDIRNEAEFGLEPTEEFIHLLGLAQISLAQDNLRPIVKGFLACG